MKRFFVCFAVFAAMFLMVSCGGSDNNSSGGSSGTSVCYYGKYECHGNDSYFCGYSGDDLMWLLSERCDYGCGDYFYGKCNPRSSNNDDNSSGSGNNGNGNSDDNSSGNNGGGNSGDNSGGNSGDNSAECTSGKFKCVGNESHYCNSNGSWVYDSRCEYGCDSSTGKCKTNSGNDDPDTSDSGDNGDSDHGDSSDTGSGDSSDTGSSSSCERFTFTCKTENGTENSRLCNYDGHYSNMYYVQYETCKAGCDSSTGKCKPWKDPETNLTWSSLRRYVYDDSTVTFGDHRNEAESYCENLSEGDFTDWRLPNIDELRTLIQDCPQTMSGGECGLTLACLKEDCRNDACGGCSFEYYNKYSKLDCVYDHFASYTSYCGDLLSSSRMPDAPHDSWKVSFSTASITRLIDESTVYVRCVR